jgi:hypothetical protein
MKKPRLLISDSLYSYNCVKGEYVLLHNGKQHFWAEICSTEPFGVVFGIVQSRLEQKNYTIGDIIQFNYKHIFELYDFTESEDQTGANTHESHLA